jgi:hypothetical protein
MAYASTTQDYGRYVFLTLGSPTVGQSRCGKEQNRSLPVPDRGTQNTESGVIIEQNRSLPVPDRGTQNTQSGVIISTISTFDIIVIITAAFAI